MKMSIKVLYLPKNFYTSPKQISDYDPGWNASLLEVLQMLVLWLQQ